LHPWALIVVDEDATSGTSPPPSITRASFCLTNFVFHRKELHVKTVKYFKSIERVQEEVEKKHADLKAKGMTISDQQLGSME
jgi:glucosamine-6-phosphate deaminase